LLNGLSTDDRARALAGARVKEFSRGDVLYREGDPVHEVLLLGSGLVKITKSGLRGTVVILRVAGPGELVGAAEVFSSGHYAASAESVRVCRVLAWRASAFKLIVESTPAALLSIVRTQAERLRELEERFHDVATDMVGPRVARQLVRLHERMAQPGSDDRGIHLSHQELAQMTGTNLYTISRLFSKWEGLGVVTSRRRAVTVRDLESLRGMCDPLSDARTGSQMGPDGADPFG